MVNYRYCQEQPKVLTIHFDGKRGCKIRENYLAMEIEITLRDGRRVRKTILSSLAREPESNTFSDSRSPLFSTAFRSVGDSFISSSYV